MAHQESDRWVLLHGWGVDASTLEPLQSQLKVRGEVWAPNLPGFGGTAAPEDAWGVEEYAHWVMAQEFTQGPGPLMLLGHSFGGRVALKIAALYPDRVKAIILVAGAGIRLPKPWLRRLYVGSVQRLARWSRACLPTSLGGWLRGVLLARIASRDYLNAGPLRTTFVKVIQEDLSSTARVIQAPALLLYGQLDTETPPQLGRMLARCLARSSFYELEGFDHYTVLSLGRFQVMHRVERFLATI